MFFNAKLPDDEVTLIRPTIGDLDFQDDEYWLLKKTLYGLCRPPHHWYNMIKGVLLKMGINPPPHDPCLISGVLNNPSSPECTSAYNPNFMPDSMLMTLYFTRLIQPKRNSSKPFYKRKSKWTSWYI